jgi:acetolactate synthase-1/2/3 large subunit
MGRPGIVSSRYANKIQQEADLVLVFGARLDMGQVAYQYKNFAPNAKKIIFDVDKNEFSKYNDMVGEVETFQCSVDAVFPALNKHFRKRVVADRQRGRWLKYCRDLKEKFNLREEHEKNDNFTYYKVIPHIEKALTEDHIVVHGSSGSCSEMTCQALELHQNTRVIGTHGLGSMGFGLPAAIGAHYATGKKVVCIEGDGSLAMNLQELELLNRYNLPICVIILNNDGYASIRNTQNKLFDGKLFGSNPRSGLSIPEYEHIVRSFGLMYQEVYYEEDSRLSVSINNLSYPVVYEIMLNTSDTISYPRTFVKKLEDGTLTTMPMEQLSPEL